MPNVSLCASTPAPPSPAASSAVPDGLPPAPPAPPPVSSGAVCARCAHPGCRDQRAARERRLGGHRAEFAVEHSRAAALQRHHRGVVVWFGEATHSYWAATPQGLVESSTIETLLAALRPHIAPSGEPPNPARQPPTGRLRAASTSGEPDHGHPAALPLPPPAPEQLSRFLTAVGLCGRF